MAEPPERAVLCYLRSDPEPPHLCDESSGVVVLVGSDGLLVGTGEVCCHLLGCVPWSGVKAEACDLIGDQ